MIGDTPEEFQALLIGIFIGILLGLKFMLFFFYLWLKWKGYLPKRPNKALIKDGRKRKVVCD